jgi:hypothetical protein
MVMQPYIAMLSLRHWQVCTNFVHSQSIAGRLVRRRVQMTDFRCTATRHHLLADIIFPQSCTSENNLFLQHVPTWLWGASAAADAM